MPDTPGDIPASIHPQALVSEDAVIGRGTSIGPGALVEAGVVVGQDCRIGAYAILRTGTWLGDRVEVDSFAVVGGLPQDLGFKRETVSGVRVGEGTVIRESVTISRSTRESGFTEIGCECLLMAGSHVAHDCRLGNRVILTNEVMLGGHISVGDFSFIGGGAGIHQFCRVGESVMVGGHASISMDLPSFLVVVERNVVVGLNLVGLRRRGFTAGLVSELKKAFRHVYSGGKPAERAKEAIEDGRFGSDEALRFLGFFLDGKRGFARPKRLGEGSRAND